MSFKPFQMINILFPLMLAALSLSFSNQTDKEFVCLPCGNACDKEVHKEAGTCPTCKMKLVEKSTIKFGNLSPAEYCKRIASNPKALILDVRSPGEFNGTTKEVMTFGHFNRAVNINIQELEQRVDELSKYKNSEVLVYCSHSHRSPQASYFLSTHGFTNVKNMSGGVSVIDAKNLNDCLKTSFVVHSH